MAKICLLLRAHSSLKKERPPDQLTPAELRHMHSAFCHKRQGPWNGVLVRPRPLEGIGVTRGTTELLRAWWKTTIIVIFVLALRHLEATSEHLTKTVPAGRLSRGRLILRHGVIITCDNQTLVVCQSLCEEAGYNQLRIHEEQNLFLQQTRAEDTSTYPAGGKIHLPIVYIYRNEKRKKEKKKLNDLWKQASKAYHCFWWVPTCSMPVPSFSMVPCEVMCILGIIWSQLSKVNKKGESNFYILNTEDTF